MAYYPPSALSSLVNKSRLEAYTSIELLRINFNRELGRGSIDIHDTFGDDILDRISASDLMAKGAVNIQLLFLSSIPEDGCTSNRLQVTASTLKTISSRLNISFAFWDAVLIPSIWSKQSAGSFHRHNKRELESIEGFYHYFNEWDKGPLHVWFQYNVLSGAITYVLVDCPVEVKQIILANAKDSYGCFLHLPFAIDLLIAEECASWREVLINKHYKEIFVWHEVDGTMDMDPPLKPEVSDKRGLQKLHQLSRTWNMIYEDLGDLEERLDVLVETAAKLEAANVKDASSAIESFKFLRARNHLRRRWVTSFGERTKLIIGFVFGIASQEDNQTNLKIANTTSTIAKETQQDNSSMITIATMTMLFLPGTFISAFFSMVFFNFGVDNNGNEFFQVSSYWWLFPAITIPCTLLIMAIYHFWRRNREGRMVSKRRRNLLTDPEKMD